MAKRQATAILHPNPERWLKALQGHEWVSAFQGPTDQASIPHVANAWAALVEATGEHAIALYFGEQFGHHSGAVNCLAALSRNARRAIDLIAEHWRDMSSIVACQSTYEDGTLVFSYQPRNGFALLQGDIEFRLAGWVTLVRMIQGSHVSPILARFQYSAPPHVAEYERIFRARLEWGYGSNELHFDAKGLDQETAPAMRWRKHAFARGFGTGLGPNRAIILHRALVMQLTELLRESSHLEDVSLKTVAPRLGVSIRTLQRSLDQHGLTFRAVLDSTRMAKAEALVRRKGITIKQIARTLGYSNQQNFTRAFHRWFGRPPTTSRPGSRQE
jgi:AraC-like DNA-binding protein